MFVVLLVSLLLLGTFQADIKTCQGILDTLKGFPDVWSYQGQSVWTGLCKADVQSPINLEVQNIEVAKKRIAFKHLLIPGSDGKVTLVKDKYTIKAKSNNSQLFMIDEPGYPNYWLQYIDFRVPAEHLINGFQYDGELRFVHYLDSRFCKALSDIAIVVIPLKIETMTDNADAFKNDFLSNIGEFIKGTESTKILDNFDIRYNITNYLTSNSVSYIHYTGSDTVPPCTQGVEYYIIQRPMRVQAAAIAQIKEFFKNDATTASGFTLVGGNNRDIKTVPGLIPSKGIFWFWEDDEGFQEAYDDTGDWAQVWAAPIGTMLFLIIVALICGLHKLSVMSPHGLLDRKKEKKVEEEQALQEDQHQNEIQLGGK